MIRRLLALVGVGALLLIAGLTLRGARSPDTVPLDAGPSDAGSSDTAPSAGPTPSGSATAEDAPSPGQWRSLAEGLEVAVFPSPVPSSLGDGRIRVVRADPAHHEIVLLSTHAGQGAPRSARAWAEDHGLLVATNPGMFHPDGRSVGYMRIDDVTVNATVNQDRAVLAVGPERPSDPPVRIIDTECDDFAQLEPDYRSLVQSIRMISCHGRNVWTQQPRIWSHAVFGLDTEGRLLVVHARSPWSTHDYIGILQGLPIGVDRLMYGEGGPEAQVYVNAGGFEAEWIGSYETGFFESDDNAAAWDLPNVLGVRRRAASPTREER